jgi:hypothetical protein
MNNRKIAFGASIALALSMLSVPALAAPFTNLVTNGDFEVATGTGMIDYNTTVDSWSNPKVSGVNGTQYAYNFLYEPGKADSTGANGWDGNVKFWPTVTNSPSGGNFVAGDGAYYGGPISQTISGLTPGQKYTLSFAYAAAQQAGFDGDNWSSWTGTFGGESFQTSTLNNPSHGFTGWQNASFTFTASSNSQVLSFLAAGGPTGVPPFALLDGVSIAPVPEPEEWAMMLVGAGLVSFQVKRKQAKANKA